MSRPTWTLPGSLGSPPMRSLALIFTFALVLAACGDGVDPDETTVETDAPEETMVIGLDEEGNWRDEDGNLVDEFGNPLDEDGNIIEPQPTIPADATTVPASAPPGEAAPFLFMDSAQTCLTNTEVAANSEPTDCPDTMPLVDQARVHRVGESCLAVEVFLTRELIADLDGTNSGVVVTAEYDDGFFFMTVRPPTDEHPEGESTFDFATSEASGFGDYSSFVAIQEFKRIFLVPDQVTFESGTVDSYTIPSLPNQLYVEIRSGVAEEGIVHQGVNSRPLAQEWPALSVLSYEEFLTSMEGIEEEEEMARYVREGC